MRWFSMLVLWSAVVTTGAVAWGHEDDGPPAGTAAASHVSIETQGDKRVVEANGLPDHKPGRFPNRGNPNSISAQHYRFEMPLKPRVNDKPRPIERYVFGVAVNGVVFDPGTAEVWRPGDSIVNRPGPETRRRPGDDPRRVWNYDAMGGMHLGIDQNHAHVQPTGAYHYHGLPTGLIARLLKERGDIHVDASLRDANSSLGGTRPRVPRSMLLIGYAADGFPIYAEYGHKKSDDASSPLAKLRPSYHLKKGNRPTGAKGPGGHYDGTFIQDYEFIKGSGDLDECNGRTGVTPEYPDGTYYFVVTDAYPFVPRFFRGTPDSSFEKHLGPPPGGEPGGGRPLGPRGRRGPPPPFPGEGPPP